MFMFWYFTFIIAYKHVMKAVLLIHKFHGFLDKCKEKFITSIYEIFSFRCVKNNMSATQRAVFRDKHNGMMEWVSCDMWTSYSKSKTKSKRLLWHVHRATNFFIYVREFILSLIAHDTYLFQWLKYRCFLISITIFNYNKKRSRVVFPQSKIALFP